MLRKFQMKFSLNIEELNLLPQERTSNYFFSWDKITSNCSICCDNC